MVSISRVRRIGPDVFEIYVDVDGHQYRVVIDLFRGIVITDYGSYPIDSILADRGVEEERSRYRYGEWAVEIDDSGIARARVSLKILSVSVNEGSTVDLDSDIMEVETMKMVERIRAPCRGVIEKIFVSSGKGVKRGEPLFKIRCLDS